jgi:AcrR family transcriptional regulator
VEQSPARPVRADARRNVEALLDAARVELIADPHAGLQRIAERAGVHRATLHRHFASREDLLTALYLAYLEDVRRAIAVTDADLADPVAGLRRMTAGILTANVHWQAQSWGPMLPPEGHEIRMAIIEAVEALLVPAQDLGAVRTDMTLEEIRVAWGGPLQLLASFVFHERWSLEQATNYLLRLIAPPRA